MMKNTSHESPTTKQIYLSHPWKLVQTGFMLLTWIALGIHNELIGPTMPTLARNVNVHYSGMGSALAFRGAGYLVANILGVILQSIVKKHSNAILMCGFILPAIAFFTTPFVTSITFLCALFFVHGIGHGLTDLSGTGMLLAMWGDHAAAPMNLVRLGYGLGAIFVNLFVRPFLITKNETKVNILTPYSITAGLCLLIAFGHLFLYIRARKNDREKREVQQVMMNPEDVSCVVAKDRGCFQHTSILSILFIGSVFFIYGNEQTFGKFFFIYLKFDRFKISNRVANWGIILYWLSYSIGRLIIAFVSIFISAATCLTIAWFGAFSLAITWLVFVWIIDLSATSLFILGGFTGLIFGPVIPLTMAFFNQRLNVAPFLLALVLCGSASGLIIFPKIGGLIMDGNPNHFPTLLFGCIVMSILIYIISNVIYFLHQRKITKNGEKVSPASVNDEGHEMI